MPRLERLDGTPPDGHTVSPSQGWPEERMSARLLNIWIATATLLAVGCSGGPARNPAQPDAQAGFGPAAPRTALASSDTGVARALALTAVSGQGAGLVDITTDADPAMTFDAQITFNVRGLAPNTTYYLQRASEFPASLGSVVHDGVCQRALGIGPWAGLTLSQRFLTFVINGQVQTITTSTGGAGALHLENASNVFADGSAFDVMFRVTSDPASNAPAVDLRTDCTTVHVK
jgi:hypothetical protein